MKVVVTVTCNTGKSWTTPINTDLAGAVDYFMGKIFTDEDELTGKETRHTVTQVTEVKPS